MDEESNKFDCLLVALQTISAELEQQRFNFKSLQKVADRQAVQKAIRDLAARFAKEFEIHTDNRIP